MSNDQVKDYNSKQLNKLYQSCLRDRCFNLTDDHRCRSLEETIGNLIQKMNLDSPGFDTEWKKYTDCGAYRFYAS